MTALPAVLPRFEVAHRSRELAIVAPGTRWFRSPGSVEPTVVPAAAPYVAIQATLRAGGAGSLEFAAASGLCLAGAFDGRQASLRITSETGTRVLRSRRHGQSATTPSAMALTITGRHLGLLLCEEGQWILRARTDLAKLKEAPTLEPHDPDWLAGLRVSSVGAFTTTEAGPFGYLGLRDIHVATHADGDPVLVEGRLLVTATCAGPGFFETAHTGVFDFDPKSFELTHRGHLYFRRSGRVLGDHATHLVRHGDSWLTLSSTWGDFDHTRVDIALSTTPDKVDLTSGEHVLDADQLAIPSPGVGVWDPHLARIEGTWHLAYTSAEKFFRFHPGLATSPDLKNWRVVGEDLTRRATEGTILLNLAGNWVVAASDGRDNPAKIAKQFPVYDLTMTQRWRIEAPYPSNIPWPMVVPDPGVPGRWLMLTFDGSTIGGPLTGYGTHGDFVVAVGGA